MTSAEMPETDKHTTLFFFFFANFDALKSFKVASPPRA
jgi:hypothetical protein